ncbi:MAG: hypothetical protein MUO21_04245 [Nitrososphaeraceae archaeon]|nr:hypothetical protein [Nitrososphaeraceae archaeon]
MKTKENIIEITKISIQKGIAWLTENEEKIETVLDLSANYKALYLYAVTGMSDRAKKYVDLISKRYIQKDGDFRTLFNEMGWPHSPSTPANRYIYPNGWIIMGLQKAGAYGLAKKGLDFLDRFQDSELGGFYSRFNVEKEVVVKCYMDTSPTSSTGLALLSCGKYKKAIMAGNFILMVLNNQTDFEKHFFTAWEKEKGLITDVFKQD